MKYTFFRAGSLSANKETRPFPKPPSFLIQSHLRNRKHVSCLFRGIETRVEVWENEKCCGNMSHRWVFPQSFRVLPNFNEDRNTSEILGEVENDVETLA